MLFFLGNTHIGLARDGNVIIESFSLPEQFWSIFGHILEALLRPC